MRCGSLYVHEPSYNTQDYGANDHQDSLLGGHDLLHKQCLARGVPGIRKCHRLIAKIV